MGCAVKIKIPLDKAYRLLNFGPTVLISSRIDGKANVMPVAWVMPIDFDPPKIAVSIGDGSYTFHIVKKTKEFVINIPPATLIDKVCQCGSVSGKGIDKFKYFGLTPIPAQKVSAPLVKECIAHLECKVIDTSLIDKYNIFLVQTVACSGERGILNEYFNVSKFKTLQHLTGEYFFVPGKVVKAK